MTNQLFTISYFDSSYCTNHLFFATSMEQAIVLIKEWVANTLSVPDRITKHNNLWSIYKTDRDEFDYAKGTTLELIEEILKPYLAYKSQVPFDEEWKQLVEFRNDLEHSYFKDDYPQEDYSEMESSFWTKNTDYDNYDSPENGRVLTPEEVIEQLTNMVSIILCNSLTTYSYQNGD